MQEWWYELNGSRVGPVTAAQIKAQLLRGTLNDKSLVWHAGLTQWEMAGTLDELAQASSEPPPLPQSLPMLAGPWRRFWARIFDLNWEGAVAGIALMWVATTAYPEFVLWVAEGNNHYALGVAILPVALLLDALIHHVLGNTPGKALMRVTVTHQDSRALSLAELVGRNMQLWITGLAAGVPFVNLLVMWREANRLRAGQRASHDDDRCYSVLAQPLTVPRTISIVIAFGVLIGGTTLVQFAAFETLARSAVAATAASKIAAPPLNWTNPVTDRTIVLPPGWTVAPQEAKGLQAYMFEDPTGLAKVLCAYETGAAIELDRYAWMYRDSMKGTLRFKDEGSYYDYQGHRMYVVRATFIGPPEGLTDVMLVQVGRTHWRTITLELPPNNGSNPMVNQLLDQLWASLI